jgi:hypothetical protein
MWMCPTRRTARRGRWRGTTGLRRVWERLAIMPESSGTAGSDVAANARTAFGNVKQLLDEARADCAAFGVPVDGRGAAAFRFTLDFLEPAGDDAW